ncbi:hypothetical protein AAVH_27303 [Aphelenchoides avenae]|nr:hypothetical protein AAVH_27303 [Aphelenchus avenae]
MIRASLKFVEGVGWVLLRPDALGVWYTEFIPDVEQDEELRPVAKKKNIRPRNPVVRAEPAVPSEPAEAVNVPHKARTFSQWCWKLATGNVRFELKRTTDLAQVESRGRRRPSFSMDIGQLADFFRPLFSGEASLEEVVASIKAHQYHLAVFEGDNMLAAACFDVEKRGSVRVGYVALIKVDESQQGTSLGRFVLGACEQTMVRLGAKIIALWSVPASVGFYVSTGYTQLEVSSDVKRQLLPKYSVDLSLLKADGSNVLKAAENVLRMDGGGDQTTPMVKVASDGFDSIKRTTYPKHYEPTELFGFESYPEVLPFIM